MVKIIWTQRSLTDLKSIAEYISQDSIKYASLTIERLITVTQHIETNPRIGRMVPEMGRKDKFREIIQGNYKENLSYELIGEDGPDHDKTFRVSAKLGDKTIGSGSGRTKKAAEQKAAYQALVLMKNKK